MQTTNDLLLFCRPSNFGSLMSELLTSLAPNCKERGQAWWQNAIFSVAIEDSNRILTYLEPLQSSAFTAFYNQEDRLITLKCRHQLSGDIPACGVFEISLRKAHAQTNPFVRVFVKLCAARRAAETGEEDSETIDKARWSMKLYVGSKISGVVSQAFSMAYRHDDELLFESATLVASKNSSRLSEYFMKKRAKQEQDKIGRIDAWVESFETGWNQVTKGS